MALSAPTKLRQWRQVTLAAFGRIDADDLARVHSCRIRISRQHGLHVVGAPTVEFDIKFGPQDVRANDLFLRLRVHLAGKCPRSHPLPHDCIDVVAGQDSTMSRATRLSACVGSEFQSKHGRGRSVLDVTELLLVASAERKYRRCNSVPETRVRQPAQASVRARDGHSAQPHPSKRAVVLPSHTTLQRACMPPVRLRWPWDPKSVARAAEAQIVPFQHSSGVRETAVAPSLRTSERTCPLRRRRSPETIGTSSAKPSPNTEISAK